MGLSSSKTKTTQDTNQTQSGTTMPVTPDWLLQGARDYTDRIGAMGDMDPNSFVAGAAPLQQQAWNNASELGNWMPQAATASGLAFNAGTGGANLAGNVGGKFGNGPYAPDRNNPLPLPQGGGKFGGSPVAPDRSSPLPLPQTDMPLPAGGQPMLGGKEPFRVTEGPGFLPRDSGLFSGQGYSPAPDMPGYAQDRPGQPIGAAPNPALTGASQAGAYSNPYDQQVIDTTLAGYDQDAGQRRAQLEAAGARNGAFGGSRFGLAEGQFDADTALGRAQTEGGMRQQGFNTANQFGMMDAASGNNMMQFNADQQDDAANRQLAAAGLLGQQANDYGASTRADLGTMAGLGDQQRGIEQQFDMAGLAQLQAMGQLSGMTPYDILVGRQVDSTGTGHVSGTQSTSPSLFNQMLALGGIGGSLFGGGAK